MTNVLEGWMQSEFTAAGYTRDVYRRGTGPGVVIVHEIPGITPKVAAFANDVVAAGFTVVMPSLVGTPGRQPPKPRPQDFARGALKVIRVENLHQIGRTPMEVFGFDERPVDVNLDFG